jgi:hypothetical protein
MRLTKLKKHKKIVSIWRLQVLLKKEKLARKKLMLGLNTKIRLI